MHEFSIASGIVESVLQFAEAHGVKRIVEVRMVIGELTCVEAEQLSFCFGAITKDSPLEAAELKIEIAKAVVRCAHCAYEGPPKYLDSPLSGALVPTLECPQCARAAEPVAGHDCAIKSIKYVEIPDPAGTELSTV